MVEQARPVDEAALRSAVRRNTSALAVCLALSWAVVQLLSALGAVTLAALTGRRALAGVAPAVFLAGWAVAGLGMGRYMDARGRRPGLAAGFAVGAAAAVVVYIGVSRSLIAVFLLGIAVVGGAAGTVNLARAAAADMYPAQHRGRGISLVLVGAAFGAILGPIAFAPILRGVHRQPNELAAPWLLAAVILAAGLVATQFLRPDPVEIGDRLRLRPSTPAAGRHLLELIRIPAVGTALVAAVVAQAVMSSMMSIIGLVMVGHGHDLAAVAVTLSAHFLGMFGLVLVVGELVDRVGRERAIVAGLVTLAGGSVLLAAGSGLGVVIPAMFALGVGWNVAFVAATAVLSDATEPHERAGLLGFSDFAAIGTAAVGAVSSAAILGLVGVMALVLTGAAIAVSPLLLVSLGIGRSPRIPPAVP